MQFCRNNADSNDSNVSKNVEIVATVLVLALVLIPNVKIVSTLIWVVKLVQPHGLNAEALPDFQIPIPSIVFSFVKIVKFVKIVMIVRIVRIVTIVRLVVRLLVSHLIVWIVGIFTNVS